MTLRAEERALFTPSSLHWIVWHTLEHEFHNGGELSLALGMQGLPAIYAM